MLLCPLPLIRLPPATPANAPVNANATVTTTDGGSAFFVTWDGTIVRSMGPVAAPNGVYQLQFANLKALGNPLNPADGEIFTLPPITISR